MATLNEDLRVRGRITSDAMTIPDSQIGDQQMNEDDPVTAAKLEHQHSQVYSQKHGTATVTERKVIHRAIGAGTVFDVVAGCEVANVGDSTITVDLRKNGVSVLTTPISLTSADANFGVIPAGIATGPYAADSVFSVVVTATVGTGVLGQGLFVNVNFREDADV